MYAQIAPQGFLGNLIGSLAPVVGNAVGGTPGQIISTVGGIGGQLLPFQAGPQMVPQMVPVQAAPQLAPQGLFGDLISRVAPVVGGAVGGNAGQVISTVGGLGQLLPFQAGPQYAQPQLAPQGLFGDLISKVAPVVGGAVGGAPGQVISTIGGLGQLLPFQAGPQYAQPQLAPQGFFGDLIGRVAPVVGGAVGGNAGQVISTVGGLGSLLPFQAGPQYAHAQLAPQGAIGNAIGTYAPIAGEVLGEWGPRVGHALGQWAQPVGNAIGAIGNLLPFQAGPQVAAPQLAPQGLFGNILGGLAPVIGGAVGGNAGQAISQGGQILGQILPFQAGPQMATPQLAPQGFFGDLVSKVAPVVGGAVGGTPGQVISTVGSLGSLLPFQAGPQYVQPQLAPQGIFGGALGSALGGALGGALGNRGLGSAIGGIAGGLLPFQAGPAAPIHNGAWVS